MGTGGPQQARRRPSREHPWRAAERGAHPRPQPVIEAVQQLRPEGVVDDLCAGPHTYDRTVCRQVRETRRSRSSAASAAIPPCCCGGLEAWRWHTRSHFPRPIPDTQPFWDAAARTIAGPALRRLRRIPLDAAGVLPECYSWDFSWERLRESRFVYTFTVAHYVAVPSFVDDAPYVVAHVTIDGTDDRVRVISNVIDVPWEKVHVGMRVRVRFEDVTPGITLPKFAPLEQG